MLSNRLALLLTTAITPLLWGTTYLVTTELLPPHRPLLAALLRALPAGLMHSSMVTSGAISQRLDRLEARGLVTRAPSETDGRGVRVTLTAEGLRLIDAVLPTHVDTEHQLLAGLSADEQKQLAGLLRTLLESLGDKRD